MRGHAPLARMKGLSLIELMIAMTIGLATVAAVGWVYLGSVSTYRTHDSLSRLQEGARYAFELIGKDLRMTGAAGCPFGTSENVLNANTDWYKDLFRQAVISEEQDGTANTETEFSDALRVLRADVMREYRVANHDAVVGVFTLSAAHDIPDGELLVATDCAHASVFQGSGPVGAQISHAAGGVPGNASANLGAGGAAYTYMAGARLYPLSAVTYYIDQNVAGEPALFRLRPVPPDATLTAEELVEGIEDLQVSFGVDTSVPADGEADFVDPDGDGDPYLSADQVDSASVPGANTQERWARVISMRISLLLRTTEDRVVPDNQTYTYNGAVVAAPDLRLRKVFTHVVRVRNR